MMESTELLGICIDFLGSTTNPFNILKRRLTVDFSELMRFNSDVAEALLENGVEGIGILRAACQVKYQINESVDIIIYNLTKNTRIEELGVKDHKTLIQIEGVVKFRSSPQPRILTAGFSCRGCEQAKLIEQRKPILTRPSICSCGGKVFSRNPELDLIENQFKFQLEDMPNQWQTMAEQIPVKVGKPLSDPEFSHLFAPGERIQLVAIYDAETKYIRDQPTPQLAKYLRAVSIRLLEDRPDDKIKAADLPAIRQISELPIEQKLTYIAPKIVGHEDIKEAILTQLVGGTKDNSIVPKREYVNILLVGDPSTGKSVIGQSVIPLKPRARYVGGSKGASGVGLTAGLIKDDDGRFVVACGATVLANGSLLVIDEFEKMHEDAIEPLHETMAQGTVTINKAGINTTMQARTAILAIANPKFGRWDPFKPLIDQVELQPSLLSRFDFIFAVKDTISIENDTKISEGILRIDPAAANQDFVMFRKFIIHATELKPELTKEAKEILQKFFIHTRGVHAKGASESKNIPIGFRQLDTLMRISEAYAKLRLSDTAEIQDAEAAISLLKRSFAKLGMDLETGAADIDQIEMGKTGSQKKMDFVYDQIPDKEIVDETQVINRAKIGGLDKREIERIIGLLKTKGDIYEPQPGFLKRM